MLILDATTKKLEFHLGGAVTTNELPFVVGYVDILTTDMSLSAVSSNEGASNGATAVSLIAAPAASHSRQLKYLSIQNRDTVAATVTVNVDISATDRNVAVFTLAANDTLFYEDGRGFYCVDSSGSFKNAV